LSSVKIAKSNQKKGGLEMLDFRDLMKDLREPSKSSLIYTLLMANILSLSIFLGTNRKEFRNKIQEETTNVNMALENKEEEALHTLVSKVLEPKNTTDKDVKEAVEESGHKNFQEMVEEGIEQQTSSEDLKATPQENASKVESTLEPEDKRLSENKKEKVINFEEAAREIRSKETTKEKPKTLVWHFPKAISKN
jgi:hypothetical protein